MRCESCQGTGSKHNLPCEECNGCGIAHCCDGLIETAHLLDSPANAAQLAKSIEQANAIVMTKNKVLDRLEHLKRQRCHIGMSPYDYFEGVISAVFDVTAEILAPQQERPPNSYSHWGMIQ